MNQYDFTNRTEAKNILDADEVKRICQIDQQTDKAVQDISGNSVHEIINHMQSRIIQLSQLEKTVRQQAAGNEEEAGKIRLISIRKAMDAATETIVTIRDAKEALSSDDPEEAIVKNKIDSVIRATTALKKAAQRLNAFIIFITLLAAY